MKRMILITALCSFLLFLWGGYQFALWMGERDKKMEAANEKAVTNVVPVIHEKTKIVYQYFYSKDKVTKEQIEMAPVFLQGLDMEQLKSIYHGWQIVLFSPDKVIVRCKIDGMSSETYILGESDGYLAVFYEDAQNGVHLKEKTDLPLSAMPDGEAMQVREGLRIVGEENLARVLSDYFS